MQPIMLGGREAIAYVIVRPSPDHGHPSELPTGEETQVVTETETSEGLSRAQFAHLLRRVARQLDVDTHHQALLEGKHCEHCAAIEYERNRRRNGL